MKTVQIIKIILLLLFIINNNAFAANRVEVKCTSEPIPFCSECGKASGFTIEFDEGTFLSAGDIITIDTSFGTTLCRGFDIMISPANDVTLDSYGNYVSGTLWNASNTPSDGSAAFNQTSDGTISTSDIGGLVFRVVGVAATQRITVYILGPDGARLTVTDAVTGEDDVVRLKFLNGFTNNSSAANPPIEWGSSQWTTPSLWEDSTDNSTSSDRVYDDSADMEDNTLYIDVSSSNFSGTTVNGNMDSKYDKYTFIPTNPQIAYITDSDIMLNSGGNVMVNVISESIAGGNPYATAGAFQLEFASGAVLAEGDKITIDLSYFSLSNKVSLSNDIDLEISQGQGKVWTRDSILGNNNRGPLYYVDDPSDGGINEKDCRICSGIYFHVHGLASQQRITLSVLEGYLKVGDEPGDKLILKLFDQSSNLNFINKGLWIDIDGDGIYGETGEDALIIHNSLKINASNWNDSTIIANMDSLDDKYTFIPSNPQIGHLISLPDICDINGDGKTGLEEAIHALQVVAGIK